MTHDVPELLDVIYRHYPRGIPVDDPRYAQSAEHARIVAVRKRAAGDERWYALLGRVSERYPGQVMNQSLHLPTGQLDACYAFTVAQPGDERALWFGASFLSPCHLTCCSALIEDVEQTAALREAPVEEIDALVHGVHFLAPASVLGLELLRRVEEERRHAPPIMRREILFSPSLEEAPHVEAISRDIATTFGTTLLPPVVGTTLVPDVATNLRPLGEATLYDCLFTDSETWVRSAPSRRFPRPSVEATRLPPLFVSVATVLAAHFRVASALRGMDLTGAYCTATTDGSLHRDEMLEALAPDAAERGEAASAARELAALLMAWDGRGAPPPAMVAWAAARLAQTP